MVFHYLQAEELEVEREYRKTGIRTLNPRDADQEMANVMKVLGING